MAAVFFVLSYFDNPSSTNRSLVLSTIHSFAETRTTIFQTHKCRKRYWFYFISHNFFSSERDSQSNSCLFCYCCASAILKFSESFILEQSSLISILFLLNFIDVRTVKFYRLLNPDWSIQISGAQAVYKDLPNHCSFYYLTRPRCTRRRVNLRAQ